MPLSPEEGRIFKEHLAKRWKNQVCPVCQKRTWQADGLSAPSIIQYQPEHHPNKHVMLGQEVYPLVHLVCTNCYYVHSFLWLPIKRGAASGE